MEERIDANGNVVGSEEWARHRQERRDRKQYIKSLKMRREWLEGKLEKEHVHNYYMVVEKRALDYVLDKFEKGTI